MERKRLTEKRKYSVGIYACDKFGQEDWYDAYDLVDDEKCCAIDDVLERLAEYEDAEEAGLIKRLPCKEGTPIYYIRKDCDANDGYREEFRTAKEFEEDCEYFESAFYESSEYCKYFDIINNDYSGYEDCSFDLKIICDKCKNRLTIHKAYFTLGKTTQIYGTEQFNPNTMLEDTYFITIPEAEKKIEEIKNGSAETN
jgi:hypothetical protein